MIRKEMIPVLLSWYRKNARDLPWRADPDAYAVYVSEIMLQQTRVEAVRDYYLRFMEELPDIHSLAQAPEDLLMKLWEGLGYYSRVRNMKKTAKILCATRGGRFPSKEEDLLALPGIGPYTAAAVASITMGQKAAAVDGNVLRVYTRLLADETEIGKAAFRSAVKRDLECVMPEDTAAFTQAWMELGALVCLPKTPHCGDCPIRDFCAGYRLGNPERYPVKLPKKARKREEKTVLLLKCEDRIALRKRKEAGLLSGLWEIPNYEGKLTEEELCSRRDKEGCTVLSMKQGITYTHVFTHREWDMVSYTAVVAEADGNYTWVTEEELADRIALPTAFAAFLRAPC